MTKERFPQPPPWFKPTPEQEALVRRSFERREAALKERLRKLYAPKKP